MKVLPSLFAMLISTWAIYAQSSPSLCCKDPYKIAADQSFKTYHSDTLVKFRDEQAIYASYILYKARKDTTMMINGAAYDLQADSVTETLKTAYEFIQIPVIPPVMDTIRDPDNPKIILAMDTMKSVGWDYARIVKLSPQSFFKTIETVKQQAKAQNLSIKDIEVLLFNAPYLHPKIESLKKKSLKQVKHARLNFHLEKNGYSLSYPVIFVK